MANEKSTRLWFAKARADLKAATYLNPSEADFFGAIVFHSQQCAEKAIKGFLTFHNIRVFKTHDMNKLIENLLRIYPDFSEKYPALSEFTLYAVEYRYPDFEHRLPSLTSTRVSDAVNVAKNLFEDLSSRVGEPLPLK
ncbi:HEPN domain-containing protein [Bdellovibrio sp. HCB-162]|uniref:HEPN domain-containing protein n=1 Tax=Bdellovibrio sp. HCB-162 TaxID=3394234 RepID=UPI0039BC6B3B